jgi:acyl-CoA synthetase (AMP-forming)/AMP-acid ligase II
MQGGCCTVAIKLSGTRTGVFRFWVVRRISSPLVTTSFLPFPPATTINAGVNLLILILIPTGGRKISSLVLESVLEEHPGIFDAAVVGVADEVCGERPKAYITAKSGAHIDGNEVIEWLKHNGISGFMVPREVEVVRGLRRKPQSGLSSRVSRNEARSRNS